MDAMTAQAVGAEDWPPAPGAGAHAVLCWGSQARGEQRLLKGCGVSETTGRCFHKRPHGSRFGHLVWGHRGERARGSNT